MPSSRPLRNAALFVGALLASAPYAALAQETTPKTVDDFRAGAAVEHSGVRDQGNAGFCWAYSTTAMIEAGLLRDRRIQLDLSEEYVAFFNIYDQLLKMAPQLFAMMKRDGTPTAKKNAAINDFVNGALILFFFHPTEGAPDLTSGPNLIEKYGIVPQSVFPFKSKGGLFASRVEGRVRRFINQTLRDPEKSKAFRKRNADGTYSNEPLAEPILVELAKAYTNEAIAPPAEGQPSLAKALLGAYRDGFTYEGVHYDPKEFAKSYLGFAPSNYRVVAVDSKHEKEGLALLSETLAKGEPAELAFTLYEGYSEQAKASGIFQPGLCSGKPCGVAGGHAVLIVNSAQDAKTDRLGGVIIQNSWGPVGLDDRGQPGETKGFQIVTLDYLRKVYTEAKEKPEDRNWTFLIRR